MTHKEIFFQIKENNLPEITVHETQHSVHIEYEGIPLIIEIENNDDTWARIIRTLIMAGLAKHIDMLHHKPGFQKAGKTRVGIIV